MLAIVFPNINNIMFSVGPLQVHWYSIAYIIGIVSGYLLLKHKYSIGYIKTTQQFWDDLFVFSIFGIIAGGRLGYVLFYDPIYFYNNPFRILMTWNGGMSFHGGLFGITLMLYYVANKHKLEFFKITDLICIVAPIGIFLGRIANFINAELVGRVSDAPWAVIFPGYIGARHPSQLYEAIGEGILLFIVMNTLWFNTNIKKSPGKLTGLFVILYSIIRFIVEFFRMPDLHIGFIFGEMNIGHIYCIFTAIVGVFVYKVSARKKSKTKG